MTPAEFGSTAWGRAWVRTIESTAAAGPNPLLPKARSLARNHAVTLTTETGHVRAEVVVSGAVHQVKIDLPPWPESSSAEAERLVADAMADHRGLASGDLPDALEADLRRNGIGIAVGMHEQEAACDCRARKRPCVHILATIYALVQRIDERPALAVELRSSSSEMPAIQAGPGWIALGDIDPASFYGN